MQPACMPSRILEISSFETDFQAYMLTCTGMPFSYQCQFAYAYIVISYLVRFHSTCSIV